ncbi:MAG: regulatory protein RecX [Deltaproteobacteria bacterium]|nr:regulatory protein RecX [Deltaproteobacteria bacterium]
MSKQLSGEETLKKAMHAAVHLLAFRSHTAYEIKQKLIKRGFSEEVISRTISECRRLNYLNDTNYARHYFESLVAKGYGPHRIRNAMRQRGLSGEIIQQILMEQDADAGEFENCRKAFQKKIKTFNRVKTPKKRKEKIYRYLYLRGFNGAVIRKIMRDHFQDA